MTFPRPMAVNPNSVEAIEAVETRAGSPARRSLPFAFAKRHGVLIQELRDGTAEAIYRTGAAAQSLAEVRRFAGMPVQHCACLANLAMFRLAELVAGATRPSPWLPRQQARPRAPTVDLADRC